jgi:hypothetical protein
MRLQVEVAEDAAFERVVTSTPTHTQAASDWTSRVLVGGLAPNTVYWYRFTDERGYGSRVGRTRTAPRDTDERPVRFAFLSARRSLRISRGGLGVLESEGRYIDYKDQYNDTMRNTTGCCRPF